METRSESTASAFRERVSAWLYMAAYLPRSNTRQNFGWWESQRDLSDRLCELVRA